MSRPRGCQPAVGGCGASVPWRPFRLGLACVMWRSGVQRPVLVLPGYQLFVFSPISMTSAVTLDAMRSTIVPADVFIINRIECDGGMLKLIAMLDKQGVPGILLDAACTSSFVLVISVPAAVG